MIRTYVINLEKDTHKKKYMIELLRKHNLDFQFVEAIDGSKESFSIEKRNTPFRKFRRELTVGEIATIFSHRKALSLFLSTGDPLALICEDDIELAVNINESLYAIFNKQLENMDVVLFGQHETWTREIAVPGKIWISRSLCHNFKLEVPARISMGAYGYVVSRRGAKRLLELSEVMDRPFDWFTGDSKRINLYILNPSVVHIKKDLEVKSNLTADRDKADSKISQKPSLKVRLIYRYPTLRKIFFDIRRKLDIYLFPRIYK
jgi:glycosyl transferase family 25